LLRVLGREVWLFLHVASDVAVLGFKWCLYCLGRVHFEFGYFARISLVFSSSAALNGFFVSRLLVIFDLVGSEYFAIGEIWVSD
jgi:hypothetical protein